MGDALRPPNNAELVGWMGTGKSVIDLSQVALTLASCHAIANELTSPKCADCHTLIMGGCYMGRWIDVLAGVLPQTGVLTLDINTNYVGQNGASVLADVLPKTQLTALNLWSNGIGDAGLRALCEALPASHITLLNLRSNRLTPKSMRELGRSLPMCTVTCLILRNNRLKDAGLQLLAESMHMSPLEILVLEGTGISDEGLKAIASPIYEDLGGRVKGLVKRSVAKSSWLKCAMKQVITGAKLKSLDVSFNTFTSLALSAVGYNLGSLALTSLNLRNCGIDDCAVTYLMKGVPDSVITTLILEGNSITSVDPFVQTLSRTLVASLNLARNSITLPSAEKLLVFAALRKDARDSDVPKTFEDYAEHLALGRTRDQYNQEAPATHLKVLLFDDGRHECHPTPNPAVMLDATLQERANDTLRRMKAVPASTLLRSAAPT